jgi:hypothetical protein
MFFYTSLTKGTRDIFQKQYSFLMYWEKRNELKHFTHKERIFSGHVFDYETKEHVLSRASICKVNTNKTDIKQA